MMKSRAIWLVVAVSAILAGPFSSQTVGPDKARTIKNGLTPAALSGEPRGMTLVKEFAIDTGDNLLFDQGLAKFKGFDLDDRGFLYVLGDKKIGQFDQEGRFLRSFGSLGQGPGEFQTVARVAGTDAGVALTDVSGQKIIVYDGEGRLIREVKIEKGGFSDGRMLKNGRYLLADNGVDPSADRMMNTLTLVSSSFEKVRELERKEYPNPVTSARWQTEYPIVLWDVGGNRIATGHQNPEYRIHVYDLDGNLQMTVEKEYRRMPMNKAYREAFLRQFQAPVFEAIRNKAEFSKHLMPFKDFVIDDQGRLFVLTNEPAKSPGENWCDVFSPAGRLIFRMGIPNRGALEGLDMKIRENRLVRSETTPSGEQVLRSFKIRWSE